MVSMFSHVHSSDALKQHWETDREKAQENAYRIYMGVIFKIESEFNFQQIFRYARYFADYKESRIYYSAC